MASITLIARDGGRTSVFTLRPDGHRSGGHSSGGAVHHEDDTVTPETVARVFELAAALPLDVPAGPRGGSDGTVTLTIQRDGARRRQFAWASGTRPGDARLLALLEAVEALRIGGG